jgi:hypothetical protein
MHAPSNRLEAWDDDPWDVFLADDDELDPEPEPGDFYPDDEELPFTDEQTGDPLSTRRGGATCCR